MTISEKPLIIIAGATGVGKTGLSVELAKRIGGDIISADSMQVYKGFDIGTAKITESEMQGVKHYLIDVLEADDEFSVYIFQQMAKEALEKIYSAGHIPILVGGTGFYIQSVLYDIEFGEDEEDPEFRRELEAFAQMEGNEALHRKLEEIDPEAAARIHPNDTKRVARAIVFARENGTLISEHNKSEREKESPYNYAYFVLNRDRKLIYERINKRVDKMVENGLVDEVNGLLEQGISEKSLAMQGLGYKEIVEYLNGSKTLEKQIEQLKLATRHFAKRQITWAKREKEAIWVNYEDYESQDAMLEYIEDVLAAKNIITKGEKDV